MAKLNLQEGEILKTKVKAQWIKGYPQTVGNLHLTNRRLILLPIQLLSLGFGKFLEISISEIQDISTKDPLSGGAFIGCAGNRLIVKMKNRHEYVFSALGSLSVHRTELLKQMEA